MQPHPQQSPRSSDTWTADDAKPKRQPKQAPTKKKSSAKQTAAKKTTRGKKPASSKKKKSAAKRSSKPTATQSRGAKQPPAPLPGQLSSKPATEPRRPREATQVAALEHKLGELERQLAELEPLRRHLENLEHQLAELSTRVAEMSAARAEPSLGGGEEIQEEDPYLRWLGHPSIEQYIGQHVALHATRGVVAHADSVAAVVESVRAQGIPLDDVCLATVPALPF